MCTVISGLKSRAPTEFPPTNSNLSVTTNADNTSIFNCLINKYAHRRGNKWEFAALAYTLFSLPVLNDYHS